MKTDSKKIIALLTIVLIASGCANNTQNDTTTQSSVISVNNFETMPSTVSSNQSFTVQMELQNTGETDANNVQALLFGPAFINAKHADERNLDFGKLEATSQTSFPKRESLTLSAPQLDEGRKVNYRIFSKIFYNYTTRATSQFKFVSNDRMREKGYTLSPASVENSPGPIQIGIRGTTPITFSSGNPSQEICITAENTGSGTVFTGDIPTPPTQVYTEEQENNITLKVNAGPGITLDPKETMRSASQGVQVNLIEGNKGWQCYTLSSGSVTNSEMTVNLRITAEYNYVKETSTSLTVEGNSN